MKDIFECNITNPGTPFIICDKVKDTTFPPGTRGYLSFIQGFDYEDQNVVFQQVITVRRGKTGKDRLNSNLIICPIFSVDAINTKDIFTTDSERKYLVDLKIERIVVDMSDVKTVSDIDFMGWMLSRALFIKELDKANYPNDNLIMKTINLAGPKQVEIIGKKDDSLLNCFIAKAERYFNNGDENQLHDEFCTPMARKILIQQLLSRESCLTIPRLEYQRKVAEVISSAIKSVKLNGDADEKENNEIIKTTINTWKNKNNYFLNLINKRLKRITDNRELLKL